MTNAQQFNIKLKGVVYRMAEKMNFENNFVYEISCTIYEEGYVSKLLSRNELNKHITNCIFNTFKSIAQRYGIS